MQKGGAFTADSKLPPLVASSSDKQLIPVGETLVERMNYIMSPNIYPMVSNVKFNDYTMYLLGFYYNTIPILGRIQNNLKRTKKEEYLADLSRMIGIYESFIFCDQMNEYTYKYQNFDLIPFMEQIGLVGTIQSYRNAMSDQIGRAHV